MPLTRNACCCHRTWLGVRLHSSDTPQTGIEQRPDDQFFLGGPAGMAQPAGATGYRSADRTVAIAKAARRPFATVINGAHAQTPETAEARDMLSELGEVVPVDIYNRIAFAQALGAGEAVTEFAPKSEAARRSTNYGATYRLGYEATQGKPENRV